MRRFQQNVFTDYTEIYIYWKWTDNSSSSSDLEKQPKGFREVGIDLTKLENIMNRRNFR